MSDPQLHYDNQVVVITGAGSGLGKAYAKFFANRGAQVVVNDLGGSVRGEGGDSKSADIVVQEIISSGGKAVADYNNVENGHLIIDTAIKTFGRVDILVNNAGILRDVTLRNMTDLDFDLIMAVHVTGSYRTTRAAWPHFRKQKFGRVIMTSSTSGLYGNFGQSNYAAAKMAVVGLAETLAKEGAKYNIRVNALAPAAGTRMTATVMPPELVEVMKPDWVVPLVGYLCHKTCDENGSIFEAAAGHFDKLRWQRAPGVTLRPDETMVPGALAKKWNELVHFAPNSGHFETNLGPVERVAAALQLPKNDLGEDIRFDGRVALVTGGGDGLGRAYAKLFGKLGAKVVINDLKNADRTVQEIVSGGGEAFAVTMSVEQGDVLVQKVIEKYGRLDIVVNNAGQLKDKVSFDISCSVALTYRSRHSQT
jgi:multifunctional beta-oxidation protein